MMKAKWVVDVKGDVNSSSFEISVLRDDNAHGKRSYGWYGYDKLAIAHRGTGGCPWSIPTIMWDKFTKLARELADELNAAESAGDEIPIIYPHL